MNDPNITMEEYIRLKEEKARRHGKVYNRETATYGRIDQRHPYLKFEGLEYTDADIVDFEEMLGRIYGKGVHRVYVFDFERLTDLMAEGLSGQMLIEHRDAQGQSVFTSRALRRLFEVRGLLVHELILEFFSTFRFREAILDLDTAGALQFQLGGARSYELERVYSRYGSTYGGGDGVRWIRCILG
uniref:Uncharacterized protein n=1 Tax=Tanacetum cinerariifolium TaxID=118510 RepID=A0A6L2LVU8_TANCI|nr:hypothetical protein [Tanacetum cinerariifolium]